MDEQAVVEQTSSVVSALLEYGALGIFALYLVVQNWWSQKRLDRVLEKIGGELSEQTTKLDSLLDAKKTERMEREIARQVRDTAKE